MYTININTYAKIISLVMSGWMTEPESRTCLEEFKRKVNNIVPSEYALIVDTKELQTAPQNSSGLMQKVQELAIVTPFKARYSFEPIRI
ncbi:MAG TPA: hypothetical protein VHP31_11735 [Caproicibacter sp.]|nr:hypothetical protein [Caproicibacter sp.]